MAGTAACLISSATASVCPLASNARPRETPAKRTSSISARLPILRSKWGARRSPSLALRVQCNAGGEAAASTATSSAESSTPENGPGGSWIPVIPTSALPRGERRLIRQDGENVLLLWYKDNVYAVENSSPAEGAYSEGMFNAKLTADGCIVCPTTESKFDLKTGEIKEWFPTNPVLALLTKPTRILDVYPVKVDSEFVYISIRTGSSGESAEIVFGGQTQAGVTASDVNVQETKMVVDETEGGFGFTPYTEMVNGRAAMLGFTFLLVQELITGEGFLKGIGFLDFLYKVQGK